MSIALNDVLQAQKTFSLADGEDAFSAAYRYEVFHALSPLVVKEHYEQIDEGIYQEPRREGGLVDESITTSLFNDVNPDNISREDITKAEIKALRLLYSYYLRVGDEAKSTYIFATIKHKLELTDAEITSAKKWYNWRPLQDQLKNLIDSKIHAKGIFIPTTRVTQQQLIIYQALVDLQALDTDTSVNNDELNTTIKMLLHKNNFSGLDNITDAKIKAVIKAFETAQRQLTRLVIFRQQLSLQQRALPLNAGKVSEWEDELCQILDIDDRRRNKHRAEGRLLSLIDEVISRREIEFPEDLYDSEMVRVGEALKDILAREKQLFAEPVAEPIAEHEQWLQAMQHIQQILDSLVNYHDLRKVKLDNVNDEVLREILFRFINRRYDSTAIKTLWRQFLICQDETIKAGIEEQLARMLGIDSGQRWRGRYLWFVPFVPSLEELIYQKMVDCEYEIPGYNAKQRAVRETKQKLTRYYCQLMKDAEQANTDEERQANEQQRRRVRNLLFCLDNHGDLTQFDTLMNDRGALQAIIELEDNSDTLKQIVTAYENGIKEFYMGAYSAMQKTFFHVKENYHMFKPRGFEHDFQQVIEFLRVLYPKRRDLENIYQQYFSAEPENENEARDQLNRFLKECIIDHVQRLQAAEFADEDVDLHQLMATLRYYKKRINKWSEKYGLDFSLRKIPAYRRLYRHCEKLLLDLQKEKSSLSAEEQTLLAQVQAYFYREISHPPTADDKDKLANLRQQIIAVMKRARIPVNEPHVVYEAVSRQHVSTERKVRRENKSRSDTVATVMTAVLAVGLAALAIYALMGLAPAIGFIPALTLAALSCLGTLYSSFILHRGPNQRVFRSLFVDGDWFNGFTSVPGRALMVACMGVALCLATLMGGLIAIAMIEMIPLLLPALICAAVVSTLAVISYWTLMYNTIAGMVTGLCNGIAKIFPEVVENGWGFKGLIKGIGQGLRRIHKMIKTPGAYSPEGGYKAAFVEFWRRIGRHLENPTGDKNASHDEIIKARVRLFCNWVIRPLWILGGLVLAGAATYFLATAWHGELTGFLLDNPFIELSVNMATTISLGIWLGVATMVEGLFNLHALFDVFASLADNAISPFIESVSRLFIEPAVVKDEVIDWAVRKCESIGAFFSHLVNDPKDAIPKLGRSIKKGFIDFFAMALDAIGEAALVVKDVLVPGGVPSTTGMGLGDKATSAISFVAVYGGTRGEFMEIYEEEPLPFIPLIEVEQRQNNARVSEVIDRVVEESPLSVNGEPEAPSSQNNHGADEKASEVVPGRRYSFSS